MESPVGLSDPRPIWATVRPRAARLAAALIITGVVLAVSVLADPVDPWFQPLDSWWHDTLAASRNPTATWLAEAFNLLGSPRVLVPTQTVVLVVLVLRRRWIPLVAFTAALVATEFATAALKVLADRPRPASLVETSGASFPSGHAAGAAVTAFGLALALLPPGQRRLRGTIAASLLAGSMAWSRTYLGAHWASDAVAGACIGAGLAITSHALSPPLDSS